MTEGTKSYLIGCHQFLLHPLWVVLAWRLEYKSWPKWWELICIILHDIGICGRQYLSDDKAKIGHWESGAKLSSFIVGKFSKFMWPSVGAYLLCAGHCPKESSFIESKLFRADKRSRVLMPTWMMWPEYWFEIKKTGGLTPIEWKKLLRKNLNTMKPFNTHELFQNSRKKLGGLK